MNPLPGDTARADRPLRVLMLAFEFPPLASGGAYRPARFARALPGLGCAVDVVAVRAADYPAWTTAPIDETAGCQLPEAVTVHRVASGFPTWYWRAIGHPLGFRAAQYLHWGDPVSRFWRTPLFELLDRLVVDHRPDVLLATAPPFGVAVLARLAARRYQLPWVVDFRDAWLRWCVAPYPTAAHYLYTRVAEARILRDANVSITTSHVTRADWIADHPHVDTERLVTVYSGSEAEASGRRSRPRAHTAEPGGLRDILYVGSFYYTPEARRATFRPVRRRSPQHWLHFRLRREDSLYRSPYFFLRGLQRLREREPGSVARLRVTFVGRVAPWLPAMLEETGTADLVHLAGVRPHAEVLQREASAAAVLLTSARVEGGRDCSIAGKTYEYFAARTPILALLSDGAMQDLVTRSGLGLLADPDDPNAIADALRAIALAADPRTLVTPNETFLAGLDARNAASALAAQLHRAAAEGFRE